ncbi:MAG: phosphoglycerate dehydrogenase [Thermodesulfobacteriota bacterium]|nr:phosphoglycerate dehydrogenase [Thermodesulfobacteriota bacterium]
MKVLVSDKLGEAGIELFKNEPGIEVDVKTDLTPEALIDQIGAYDALVIRSATRVTAEVIAAATNLKVIGRAGIGLDNVDVPAATQKGIVVMNTPTGNTITTAEHAIAMMMALSRNIPQATISLKAGRWEKKKLQGREMMNKTLGLLGFGKIGSIVADRARGLRMNVIIFDPNVNPEKIQEAGYESVSLDELYARSDYITIHVPKMEKTIGLLNADAFSRMKDGIMIINCARGGIIDEAALYDALKSGKVAGAALDVFAKEPPGEHPLLTCDNVICTPHLGASTQEAQTNVAVDVARQIIAYLKEGTIINAVNTPSVTGDRLARLKPYLELGRKLGLLLAQIHRGKLQEVAIEYSGEYHDLELGPISTALINGLLEPLVREGVNAVNAPAIAREMGIKVTETLRAEPFDYLNLMTVRVTATEQTDTVSGTLFGKIYPRIVEINDFRVDVSPEGHMLIILSENKPGVIGKIGTTFGEGGVNIVRFMVGNEAIAGQKNMVIIKTDEPVPADILETLKNKKIIFAATPVNF